MSTSDGIETETASRTGVGRPLVFFYPTRFHIFDQLNTASFAKDDFELYTIYPPRYFRAGRFASLAARNRTLWFGLTMQGLLRFARKMQGGSKVARLIRSWYIRVTSAEFVWRLRAMRPSLVITSAGYLGANVERLQGAGHLVCTIHGSLYEPWVRERMSSLFGASREDGANWAHTELIMRMEREFEMADRVIVCSPTARESFPEKFQDRITVVPLGAPSPLEAKRSAPLYHPTGTTYLHISNLSFGKNVTGVLNAFAQIRRPQDRLIIGGPAPHDRALLRRLADPEPGVQWLGRLDRVGVAQAMAKADIFVHPSFADGWGMVITEALAAGLPIIASSDTGAASYYAPLNPKEIILVDPTSIDEISDAMSKMSERITSERELVPQSPMSWEASSLQLLKALSPLRAMAPSVSDPS